MAAQNNNVFQLKPKDFAPAVLLQALRAPCAGRLIELSCHQEERVNAEPGVNMVLCHLFLDVACLCAANLRKKPKKDGAGEDPTSESSSLPEPDDDGYRCIVRATDGRKKISTLVSECTAW